MLRHAYYATFTRPNVMATFEKAGMWPVNSAKLMSVPVHRSANDVATVLTVAELDELSQAESLVARRRILGEDVVVTKQGFVDTTVGAVLTNEAAIAMTAEKSRRDAERLAEKAAVAARHDARRAERAAHQGSSYANASRRRKTAPTARSSSIPRAAASPHETAHASANAYATVASCAEHPSASEYASVEALLALGS